MIKKSILPDFYPTEKIKALQKKESHKTLYNSSALLGGSRFSRSVGRTLRGGMSGSNP